jgi:hypothetical protein
MWGMVLEAFKSEEPRLEVPTQEEPRRPWLPILIGNTCWIAAGLLAFAFTWWLFGPMTAAVSMLFVGSAFFSLMRWLTWLGKL